MFQDVPSVFLIFWSIWCSKMRKYRLLRVKKSRNHEHVKFLMSKIMKSRFYYTKLKQINSRKLLKVLFKYMSPHIWPKNAITIPILFPMIFLWISCDFPILGTQRILREPLQALSWALGGLLQWILFWGSFPLRGSFPALDGPFPFRGEMRKTKLCDFFVIFRSFIWKTYK